MTSWQEFTDQAPEFAARAQARLRAFTHLTMATLRADGSPRISGNEIRFWDGDLLIAGMTGSRRFADLRRDPRLAIHSGSAEPPPPGSPDPAAAPRWDGDAKVSGSAHEITDPERLAAFATSLAEGSPGEFELFAVHLSEVTWVGLNPAADTLLIETWTPGGGLVRHER